MKRAWDIFLSLGGLVLLAPLLATIAFAIVLTSGRPAIFSQVRVGLKGRRFVIKKFRTMTPSPGSETGAFRPGHVERITAFGRLLRATKFDELPQLWNVLKGEMSMVGPRPEVPMWVEAYPDLWNAVLSIKPGITDPASLAYRDEESTLRQMEDSEDGYRTIILPQKLDLYGRYVKTNTVSGDMHILLETLERIIRDNLRRK